MKKTVIFATSCAFAAGAACAQGYPSLSFSGYGTLGIARTDEDRADYLVDAFKPDGPGRSDKHEVIRAMVRAIAVSKATAPARAEESITRAPTVTSMCLRSRRQVGSVACASASA